MTFKQAKREFETVCADLYIKRVDYWRGQIAWAEFVDWLEREVRVNPKISTKWDNPFPYGKPLVPKKWQLERKVLECITK